MNTQPTAWRGMKLLFSLVLAFSFISGDSIFADILPTKSSQLQGMYKVGSSNDPTFPMKSNEEWFLDFGDGISQGELSGKLAVSLRQNPNVQVRILVWQYFPKEGRLVIGNQYHEGSKNAVALATWEMESQSSGFVLDRGERQVVLMPASTADY